MVLALDGQAWVYTIMNIHDDLEKNLTGSGSRQRNLQTYPAKSKITCRPFLVFPLHQSHEINETMKHMSKNHFNFLQLPSGLQDVTYVQKTFQ